MQRGWCGEWSPEKVRRQSRSKPRWMQNWSGSCKVMAAGEAAGDWGWGGQGQGSGGPRADVARPAGAERAGRETRGRDVRPEGGVSRRRGESQVRGRAGLRGQGAGPLLEESRLERGRAVQRGACQSAVLHRVLAPRASHAESLGARPRVLPRVRSATRVLGSARARVTLAGEVALRCAS